MSFEDVLVNSPASPSLLARGFLQKLALAGVTRLTSSQLKQVERLDALWASGRDSRVSRLLAGARR